MGSEISRNDPCPCGSGRKFKRCCQDLLDNPVALAKSHDEVGSRIQAWADQHQRQQLQAGLEEILGGYEDIVVGDADLQLVGTWLLSDRELPVGGTIAERYAGREDISREERDIAQRIANARITLLKVKGATPGRSISVHDIGRDEYVTVFSHGVSKSVKPGDVIVARIMAGPPAPSLWGPVAFLDRHSGRELRELLTTRIRPLGLRDEPGSLAMALQAASREITALVVPALRRARHDQLAA
jgi:SEC-C motif